MVLMTQPAVARQMEDVARADAFSRHDPPTSEAVIQSWLLAP